MTSNKPKILLGSPIHQKPAILKEFLSTIAKLQNEHYYLNYFFIDNNEDPLSKEYLRDFKNSNDCTSIEYAEDINVYVRDDQRHYWNEQLIWKVAEYKNKMIDKAMEEDYDYLFLVDSDLILHPETINYLLKANKDIISEVFWTKWETHADEQPQVWISDEYKQWVQQRGETLSEEEVVVRYQQFISKMRTPGVYEVGGLGACTLISRNALQAGVNFKQIKNLSFWGEDRHFCIRACALGLSLHVDTHVPPLHLYRDSDLQKVESYRMNWKTESPLSKIEVTKRKPKLTLSMIVKNESGRFLKQVLKSHLNYIDEAVIIDDASTDDTVEICLEILKDIPVRLVRNKKSKFANEVSLRRQQWEETISTNPDWIINLDADEIFEDSFAKEVQQLLEQDDFDVYSFRLYDFWNSTHYREDEFWQAHQIYRPFLVRYRKEVNYTWNEVPLHCGRFPENIFELPNSISDLRIKHLGWINSEERLAKFKRYQALDPESKYGNIQQYLSIMDENPKLIPWEE
ncbi:glycosyltransferase [Rummeliibacillus sp. JY-2-4R]